MQMLEALDPQVFSEGFHVHVTDDEGALLQSYSASDFPQLPLASQSVA